MRARLGFRYPGFEDNENFGPDYQQPDVPQIISNLGEEPKMVEISEAHRELRERLTQLTAIVLDTEFSALPDNVRLAKLSEMKLLERIDAQLERSY